MTKVIIFFILVLAALGAAFWVGHNVGSQQPQEAVSSRVILDSIQDQAFLVTKTLYLDEEVTVTVADPKGWKGFFVGDQLHARALVRTDVGVDLQGLSEEDIQVDSTEKKIRIKLPEAGILTSGIAGNVEVENSRGLWTSIKELFSDNQGDDYNRAVKELVSNAEASVRARADVFDSARADTAKLISWMTERLAPTYQAEITR